MCSEETEPLTIVMVHGGEVLIHYRSDSCEPHATETFNTVKLALEMLDKAREARAQ